MDKDNATLKLRGMSCASCANSIEDAIRSLPGVCMRQFGAELASVTYDPKRTDLEAIQDAVDAAGYPPSQCRNKTCLETMILNAKRDWQNRGS